MASKKTLNAKNLEALGAERLAQLLIEVSTGNAEAKRQLRLELAGALSPADAAKEVRKRLSTIQRSDTFVNWENRHKLVKDLQTQCNAITNIVGKYDPETALELLWRFVELADSIFARCDDSSGTVTGIFHDAVEELIAMAIKAKVPTAALADNTFSALCDNGYGQYDPLLRGLAPVLGTTGLEHIKARMIELKESLMAPSEESDRVVVPFNSSSDRDYKTYGINLTVKSTLTEIADLLGDLDGFTAQFTEEQKKVPQMAARIAQRFLVANDPEKALEFLDGADIESARQVTWINQLEEWTDTRICALQTLGRREEAQGMRWQYFEDTLSSPHLRDYLDNLPEFEDVDAELKAIDYAFTVENVHAALAFLVSWKAMDKAKELVLRRYEDLDGDIYQILTPCAEKLSAKSPLAASLILRKMIDFSLEYGRSSRYKHCANHFMECNGLATVISDFQGHETHEAFASRLKQQHGRKTSFWNRVS
ncbi:DUF6880 family protein [Pseudovibrio sp. Tun.PSC04-5.I4]|uniref:DUF6880 family protein n=1 Tax=Pseudovibrio sp. Tun.PSC04-5.I4 TaxID=1798213 RepID=UPI00088E1C77|nr:DUF6880 family protein [Pseudovibrio sp. Tun.PSC04-5.I4]SDR02374.1 hypothetical protein SAMN04515695_2365 [Pseudovibrio sp. Tun.PSC04-5.I4]